MQPKNDRNKGDADRSPTVICDFNTLHWEIDRQKKFFLIIKDIDLKDTFNHFDLIDIYKTPHPIATGYPFLASTHKTFTKVRGGGGRDNGVMGTKEGP